MQKCGLGIDAKQYSNAQEACPAGHTAVSNLVQLDQNVEVRSTDAAWQFVGCRTAKCANQTFICVMCTFASCGIVFLVCHADAGDFVCFALLFGA